MTRISLSVSNALITAAAGLNVSIVTTDGRGQVTGTVDLKEHITRTTVVDGGTGERLELVELLKASRIREDDRRFWPVAREPKQKAQWKRERQGRRS